jgi:hypothetical protein
LIGKFQGENAATDQPVLSPPMIHSFDSQRFAAQCHPEGLARRTRRIFRASRRLFRCSFAHSEPVVASNGIAIVDYVRKSIGRHEIERAFRAPAPWATVCSTIDPDSILRIAVPSFRKGSLSNIELNPTKSVKHFRRTN